MTSKNGLGDFEGHPVVATAVAITQAGDGLSKALNVHPRALHQGDVVHVVLECKVTKIAFAPVKDTGTVERVHTLAAGSATLIDERTVRHALDETAKAIEEAEGVQRLDFDGAKDTDAPDDPGDKPTPAKTTAKKAPAKKAPAKTSAAKKSPAAKAAAKKAAAANGMTVIDGGKDEKADATKDQ